MAIEALANLAEHAIDHAALNVKGVPVLDTRYVNVTGDTMTGDLTIEASLIVNAHNGIYFGSTSGSNIYFDSFGLNLYSVNAAGADDRIALWNGSGATMLMANPSANHTNYFPATTGEVAILPQNYVIATVSVNDGGTGYAVGNVLILEGGNADGRVTVSTVNDGVITGVNLTTPGTGYQVQNVNTVGGSGSGAIISIDSIVAEDPRTMAMLEVENVFTVDQTMDGILNIAEIRAKDANGLKLYDDGGNGIFVDDGGNVGIGTTSLDTKLEVLHAGNQLKLSFDGTDNAVFAVDTNGDLSIDPSGIYINVGKPTQNDKQLRFYQGSNGTSGNTATVRADYNNLYISNSHGKVMIEHAIDQNHALGVQEGGSPWEKMDWWFDGSSGTGTGVWMSANYHAGDINMKLGNADAATWGFKIIDWWNRELVTIDSLGGAHFNIQSKDADFIIEGNTEANLFRVDAGTDEVRMGDWDTNYLAVSKTGTVTLTGTARVTRDLWIDAAGIKAPGAKPATEVSFGALETSAWEFSNEAVEANQESVSWRIAVPYDFDRTEEVIIRLGWTSASTGNCKWQLKYRWFSEDEDMTQDGEETLTATDAASATANGLVVTTIEGINAPSATDATIIFKLTRLSADENDTIGDAVELHGACFNYISNKLGEATT